MRLSRGIPDAIFRFLLVGVVFPLALVYFSPEVARYVELPPAQILWAVMIAFGALFALVGFLQNAYSKGEYPWLLGKIGGGAVAFAFFSYLLIFLPAGAASQSFQLTGLLILIYLSIGLSYVHLLLDFYDARRGLRSGSQTRETL